MIEIGVGLWYSIGNAYHEFVEFIKNYNSVSRPAVMELLHKYSHKRIFIFENRKDANNLLSQIVGLPVYRAVENPITKQGSISIYHVVSLQSGTVLGYNKTDWYDLDFMYLKSNPSFEAFQIYRRIKKLKNTYMDIFPETAFEERRQFILDFYADGAANIEEHSTYLSKEELDVFVTSAVNEIITQIRIVGGYYNDSQRLGVDI